MVPPALVAAIAGLALINPLIGALSSAFGAPDQRFTAAATLIVAASGVSVYGIGAACWGLLAGLLVQGLARIKTGQKKPDDMVQNGTSSA